MIKSRLFIAEGGSLPRRVNACAPNPDLFRTASASGTFRRRIRYSYAPEQLQKDLLCAPGAVLCRTEPALMRRENSALFRPLRAK